MTINTFPLQNKIVVNNIPITVKNSRKTCRIAITIAPFKGVTVNMPRNIPISTAKNFIIERMDWIIKSLAKMKSIEEQSQGTNQAIPKLDIKASRAKLIKRIYELAHIHNFDYNGITIRQQKTVWGSCTVANHINLNLRLAWLPQELIDYVILHELTHTQIKNHSRDFWESLEKLIGNAKTLRKKLKNYRYLHCA